MYNKIKILGIVGLAVSSMALGLANNSLVRVGADSRQEPGTIEHRIDFYYNYLRQEFTLSNGTKGKGNNLLYKTVTITGEHQITKPEDPTRKNYEFDGWYKEESCKNEWNFTTNVVLKDTRLYAKWSVASAEEITEPPYTPPSTVLEESASVDYQVDSVMNFKISNNEIKVSKAALLKLEDNKDNVLPLMEYKAKNSKPLTATFADNKITLTCNGTNKVINVKDGSEDYRVNNSNYETKAKNYENKALEEESHHVMLAGSSSIEFWTSSKEDLAPIVSYNHGIGGTTIEEWDECLNQRLVFPYKPKMVVYYVGINNVINSKQDAGTIWNNLSKFLNDTHAAMPNTKVQYIMMNLIPGYKGYYDVINSVNANVVQYQKSNASWLTLINPGEALIKENGEPNAAYFRTDGLHLSYYGYVVWGGIIKQSILEGLENY